MIAFLFLLPAAYALRCYHGPEVTGTTTNIVDCGAYGEAYDRCATTIINCARADKSPICFESVDPELVYHTCGLSEFCGTECCDTELCNEPTAAEFKPTAPQPPAQEADENVPITRTDKVVLCKVGPIGDTAGTNCAVLGEQYTHCMTSETVFACQTAEVCSQPGAICCQGDYCNGEPDLPLQPLCKTAGFTRFPDHYATSCPTATEVLQCGTATVDCSADDVSSFCTNDEQADNLQKTIHMGCMTEEMCSGAVEAGPFTDITCCSGDKCNDEAAEDEPFETELHATDEVVLCKTGEDGDTFGTNCAILGPEYTKCGSIAGFHSCQTAEACKSPIKCCEGEYCNGFPENPMQPICRISGFLNVPDSFSVSCPGAKQVLQCGSMTVDCAVAPDSFCTAEDKANGVQKSIRMGCMTEEMCANTSHTDASTGFSDVSCCFSDKCNAEADGSYRQDDDELKSPASLPCLTVFALLAAFLMAF